MKTQRIIYYGFSLFLLVGSVVSASEKIAKEEEELDALLGVAEKTFVIHLAALKTRTELSEKAQIRTGLPGYDQQVERAQGAPTALVNALKMIQPSPPGGRSSSSSGGTSNGSTGGEPGNNGGDNGNGGNCNVTVFPPVCN